MSLAQLHYTSAPPGPDGSGFRFTAVSPGVPATLLREAEQLIGYEPPRDLPDRPDAEQLKSFPKAFSCTELADGGRLLCRSVYTGADYSGRWGNFHAHAVHLPPGTRLPDGALPITVWESPRWAEATPPGGRPEPVDRIEPSRLLRRDGLVSFARSRADRLAAFFADLRTLADGSDVRQLVLVERDSADVAQWIALACTVLPREQAHRLTFTTYTRRPQQARQQIVGALPSSEPVGHDHRFRVHDCTGRAAGEPVADAWAEVCARIWTAGRPELFRDTARDLGDTADDVGRLAVTALAGGIALPPAARRGGGPAGRGTRRRPARTDADSAARGAGAGGGRGRRERRERGTGRAGRPVGPAGRARAHGRVGAARRAGADPGGARAGPGARAGRGIADRRGTGRAGPGPRTGPAPRHRRPGRTGDRPPPVPAAPRRPARRRLHGPAPGVRGPHRPGAGEDGAGARDTGCRRTGFRRARSAAAGPEAPGSAVPGSAVPGSAVPRSEMPGPAWPRPTHRDPTTRLPASRAPPGPARACPERAGQVRPGRKPPSRGPPAREPTTRVPRSRERAGPDPAGRVPPTPLPPVPPALLDALRSPRAAYRPLRCAGRAGESSAGRGRRAARGVGAAGRVGPGLPASADVCPRGRGGRSGRW